VGRTGGREPGKIGSGRGKDERGIQEKRGGAGRCKVQEVKGLDPLSPFILKGL